MHVFVLIHQTLCFGHHSNLSPSTVPCTYDKRLVLLLLRTLSRRVVCSAHVGSHYIKSHLSEAQANGDCLALVSSPIQSSLVYAVWLREHFYFSSVSREAILPQQHASNAIHLYFHPWCGSFFAAHLAPRPRVCAVLGVARSK